MESNDSPEIPDRGETSDIPGLPSGVNLYPVQVTINVAFMGSASGLAYRRERAHKAFPLWFLSPLCLSLCENPPLHLCMSPLANYIICFFSFSIEQCPSKIQFTLISINVKSTASVWMAISGSPGRCGGHRTEAAATGRTEIWPPPRHHHQHNDPSRPAWVTLQIWLVQLRVFSPVLTSAGLPPHDAYRCHWFPQQTSPADCQFFLPVYDIKVGLKTPLPSLSSLSLLPPPLLLILRSGNADAEIKILSADTENPPQPKVPSDNYSSKFRESELAWFFSPFKGVTKNFQRVMSNAMNFIFWRRKSRHAGCGLSRDPTVLHFTAEDQIQQPRHR